MVNIPMRAEKIYDKNNISELNTRKISKVVSKQNVNSLNNNLYNNAEEVKITEVKASPQSVNLKRMVIDKPIQRGQKVSIGKISDLHKIKIKINWEVINKNCDIDVSAFLVDNNSKALGEDWFIFYSETESPDKSTVLEINGDSESNEYITVDLDKLNNDVNRIVFVLTIDEALSKKLNFGMVKEASIKIVDANDKEITGFKVNDFYTNMTSLMIGEIYKYKEDVKFNAIGNGVEKDLAGLCNFYGIDVE